MKELIMGLMCLALAACKFSEDSPNPYPKDQQLVYKGQLNTENLEYVGLHTQAPERDYNLNLLTQVMTIQKQECQKSITLSNTQATDLINALKQVRLCGLSAEANCIMTNPLITNTLMTYYHQAIDPDYIAVDIPIWCHALNGLCSQQDITSILEAFDTYKDAITCP